MVPIKGAEVMTGGYHSTHAVASKVEQGVAASLGRGVVPRAAGEPEGFERWGEVPC